MKEHLFFLFSDRRADIQIGDEFLLFIDGLLVLLRHYFVHSVFINETVSSYIQNAESVVPSGHLIRRFIHLSLVIEARALRELLVSILLGFSSDGVFHFPEFDLPRLYKRLGASNAGHSPPNLDRTVRVMMSYFEYLYLSSAKLPMYFPSKRC